MSAVLSKARLVDVADLNPSQGEVPAEDETVSFLPMSAVDAESVDAVDSETRPFAQVSKGYTPFLPNDVLVAKITPCFENGKIAHAKPTRRFGFGSTEFHVVRAHAGTLDPRYLVHFLRQDRIRLDGQRKMTGSAGQRRVPEHFLAGLQIPLPPLPEQRRIAEIFDKADALRAKRRAALAQLDTLTQSIFLDMFGDPATNPKGLPTTRLGDVCTRITDGTHQPPAWSPTGNPFLFVSNIINGEITFDTEKFISDETHAELTRRCPIDVGDVLYSTVGSYGVPAVVRTSRKFAFQRHIAHLKPDRNVLDSEYLRAMLASPPLKRQADRAARGVAQKTVNLADIREFLVFTPPLELQCEFSRRGVVIEQMRAAYRCFFAELDALFAALQYHAFRGELLRNGVAKPTA